MKSHLDEAGLRGLLGGSEPRKTPPTVCPHCGVQLRSQVRPLSPKAFRSCLKVFFSLASAELGRKLRGCEFQDKSAL